MIVSNSFSPLVDNSSFSDLPQTLQHPLNPVSMNERIVLYSGQVNLTQLDLSFDADTDIFWEWFPSPQIRFQVPIVPSGFFPTHG
jgi:hypothetical protein